jgi:hypothetical protein
MSTQASKQATNIDNENNSEEKKDLQQSVVGMNEQHMETYRNVHRFTHQTKRGVYTCS